MLVCFPYIGLVPLATITIETKCLWTFFPFPSRREIESAEICVRKVFGTDEMLNLLRVLKSVLSTSRHDTYSYVSSLKKLRP
jgi:hypothetical protein